MLKKLRARFDSHAFQSQSPQDRLIVYVVCASLIGFALMVFQSALSWLVSK